MGDINHAPVCGLYCGSCSYLDNPCPGCGYVEGKPFWTSQIPTGVCPIYACCRNEKKLEHCGLCDEFPCQTFLDLRDPSMSDEQFQQSLDTRRNNLQRRAQAGTDQWLREVSKTS